MTALRSLKTRSWIILVLIVTVALLLRLIYLLRIAPWTDEYFTSFAIQMTAEKGVPVMPSSLFYTHGILYTYMGALLVRLFGYNLPLARLPSLLVSLPAVLLVYNAGRQWFNWRVGLLAAIMLALSPEAIAWGGQARMYALWQFCTLAAVYFLHKGLLKGGATNTRVWGLLALSGAILCHLRTLLTIPPLILGLLLAWWLGRRQDGFVLWRPRRMPWAELIALVVVLASPLLFFAVERPSAVASSDQINLTNWLNPIRLFVDILIGAQQFVIWPYLVLTVLALSGILALFLRLLRRQPGPHDPALLYLNVIGLGILVEFSLVSPPIVRVPRYLFDVLPLYFLVVARELDFLTIEVETRVQGAIRTAVGLLPALLIVVLFTQPALLAISTQRSAVQPALEYVRDHWQPGDRIATPMPALAYLVIGHCDYFVALDNPFLWPTEAGSIDPYLGLPWIGTENDLRQIADESSRLWLVVEKRYADPYLSIFGSQLMTPFQELDTIVYLVSGIP